ncbi:hypothetical protein B0O99DRAFT_746454 [Bisporella sp. PMI_857]|nr:hypothetical protein B0O99DRAFT_746454 [Bisporella sp. PMI_857]
MTQNTTKSQPAQQKVGPEQEAQSQSTSFIIYHDPPDVPLDVDIIAIGNGERDIWDEIDTAWRDDDERMRERDEWDEKKPITKKEPQQDGELSKNRSSPKAVNWMTDRRMLRSIIPNSRMMEFRYSKKEASLENLRNLTERFLRCFSERCGPPDIPVDSKLVRPIIFIAYGHGGLVLELAVMIWYSQRLSITMSTLTQANKPPKTSMPFPANVSALPPDTIKIQPAVPLGQGHPSGSNAETSKSQPQDVETKPIAEADPANPKRNGLLQALPADGKARTLSISSPEERGSKELVHDKALGVETNKLKTASNPLPDMSVVSGIVLLGSTREIPKISLKEVEPRTEEKPTLEKQLDACLRKYPFKETTKNRNHTIYHTCFERIINQTGIATQYYRGSDQYDAEAGIAFELEPASQSVSLCVTDLSNPGKSPLSRYLGPDDPRYMKLRRQVQIFLQEFLFFRAVRSAMNLTLTDILEKHRIDPDKPRFLGEAALHIATRQGFPEIVSTLVSWYADIGLKAADGKTALQIAVENLDQSMVELLLKKGAKPDALDDILSRLANEEPKTEIQDTILALLKGPPLVDGPFKTPPEERHERPQRGGYQDWPQPAPQHDGEIACKSFHITIGNFFSTDAGQEVSDIRTASIHDILYVTEPDEICKPVLAKAEMTQKGLGKTRFTWYHVPANNIDWVEGLFARLGMQNLLPLDAKEHRGMKPWSSKMVSSVKEGKDRKSLSLFLPFLNVETSSNRKEMSKVIKRVEQARHFDEERSRYWFSDEDYDEALDELPDASLIRAYMKDSKGLHVRRTLDQSHYSMLPSTEERDVDQILLKRGKRAQRHEAKISLKRGSKGLHVRRTLDQSYYSVLRSTEERDVDQILLRGGKRTQRHQEKSSLKVVMVDQLWLWMFEDVLITSFPQTWRQTKNASNNYDFLTNLVEHIRGPREEPFCSVKDLAVTIVKRCSTIFTTDAKLLFPHPYLLEIYQEAIGDVSAKEATFFRNFNADLEYLSMLYKRVQDRHKRGKEYTEMEFRRFLEQKFRKSHGDLETDWSDSDGEMFSSRRRYTRYMRYTRWREHEELKAEMIEDPEKKISELLDSFNNITEETSQLIEVKDIIDELKMILEVQDEQNKVLDDFARALNRFALKDENQKAPVEQSLKNVEVQSLELKNATDKVSAEQSIKNTEDQSLEIKGEPLMASMEQFVKNGKDQCLEIKALSKKAKDTLEAINQVLELKQKQANASEARTTRMQAEQSDRQGKTLMVFTIVTIIFLPLSFMAAFFAIPVSDWPKNKDGTSALSFRYVSKFIFPLSVAIILPFLILAFTVNGMRDRIRNSKRHLDFVLMDVRSRWRKLWIIFSWVTHPAWHPIFQVIAFIWDFVYWNIWDSFKDWVDDAVAWVKEGSLKLVERLQSLKRKKGPGSDDPESREGKDGVDPSVNEKLVGEKLNDEPPK